MKTIITLLTLCFALNSNAATYLLLSQTNAFAKGITNEAKAYADTKAPLDSPALIGNPLINGQSVETELTNKVAKSGDTMTGDLHLPTINANMGHFSNGITAAMSVFTNDTVAHIPISVTTLANTTNQWLSMSDNTALSFQMGAYYWTDATVGKYATITMETCDDTGWNAMKVEKSRGTKSARTAIVKDDGLLTVSALGYDGSKYNIHADSSIGQYAGGAFTATSHPTYVGVRLTGAGSTNASEVFRISTNGAVLIGQTGGQNPAGIVETMGLSSDPVLNHIVVNGLSGNPGLQFRRSRASSAVVQNGDVLGVVSALGNDGQDWGSINAAGSPVLIAYYAAETFNSTAHGAYIVLSTTPTASTTRAERIRITSSGNVGIATISPTSTLHVAGSMAQSTAVGGAFTLTDTNDVYFCNVADQLIKLPTPVGHRGRRYEIWVVAPAGSAIITNDTAILNGAQTLTIPASNTVALCRSDGTNWYGTLTTKP